MKCKLQIKTIENKKDILGGLEFGLTEICPPFLGSITAFYSGRFLGEKIFFHILGEVATFRLMILKYDPSMQKPSNCNDVFFLLTQYLNISTFKS